MLRSFDWEQEELDHMAFLTAQHSGGGDGGLSDCGGGDSLALVATAANSRSATPGASHHRLPASLRGQLAGVSGDRGVGGSGASVPIASVYELEFGGERLGFRVRNLDDGSGCVVVSSVSDPLLAGLVGDHDMVLAVNGAPLG